ncbi:MAG: hypothetical protein EDM05_55975 (plasmid) [Leptolyngbya sp. IPPAS B-1204]
MAETASTSSTANPVAARYRRAWQDVQSGKRRFRPSEYASRWSCNFGFSGRDAPVAVTAFF